MDRRFTSSLSPFWIRASALGLVAVFPLVAWFVATSSALIDFTVAVVAAVVWCLWLERSPSGADLETGSVRQTSSDKAHKCPPILGLALVVSLAAHAQTSAGTPDPNPGNLTLTGSFDVVSMANYYELNTGTSEAPLYVDDTFGYFSVAGIVTVPLGGTTKYGAWNLHGGIELQALGDTTKALNGGDGSKVMGSVGIGFSY